MIDTVKIKLVGGRGGNGCISFRRERSIPKGGPDGGDGGRGGNVYLCGRESLNSLLHLSFNRIFRAERGGHGGGKNRHGRNGDHRVIHVPMGTIVWEMGMTYSILISFGNTIVWEHNSLGIKIHCNLAFPLPLHNSFKSEQNCTFCAQCECQPICSNF